MSSGMDLARWARFVVAANASTETGAPVVLSAAVVNADEAPAAWPVTILAGAPGTAPATATPTGLPATLLPLAGSVLDVGDSSLGVSLAGADGPVTVELRLSDSTRGDARYWSTYLQIDPATQSWHVAPTKAAPIVPVLRTPQVGQDRDVVTVTGSVAAATDGTRPTGWVELFDGPEDRGAARYDPTTGDLTAKDVPNGSGSMYHFVFTPAADAEYAAADSAMAGSVPDANDVATASATPAPTGDVTATGITITVTPPADAAAYSATEIAADVTPADVVGTVEFRVGTDFSASVPVTEGHTTLTTNSLGAGTYVVAATFTPSAAAYAAASAASAPFTLNAAGGSEAAGSVAATVPVGPLTITTPYGPGHPLQMGDLALAPDGSRLVATAHVGTAAGAAHDGIMITDTRAGDPGWSATLSASDLTSGAQTINAQNLGFIGIHPVAVPGFGGGGLGTSERPVATRDIAPSSVVEAPGSTGTAGLAGTPKVFASAAHGRGSVYIYGDLRLQAPTSAITGEYAATLIFTVS